MITIHITQLLIKRIDRMKIYNEIKEKIWTFLLLTVIVEFYNSYKTAIVGFLEKAQRQKNKVDCKDFSIEYAQFEFGLFHCSFL